MRPTDDEILNWLATYAPDEATLNGAIERDAHRLNGDPCCSFELLWIDNDTSEAEAWLNARGELEVNWE